ncbi:MAG TPA: long-chain-acyl-CoA synthetase [Candidatus Binataceae bacterium]|nr:long-chain-acyl-CoA synthetase [Candidatus Binataceae bacterium]
MADSTGTNRSPLKAWVRALEITGPIEHNPSVTLPLVVQKLADQFGPKLALADDDDQMTYRELAEQSNRYARWAVGQGINAGDIVCLLMRNCPRYFAIWLGITQIGGIVSLLNTNLTGSSLAYAINIVAPKHIIVGSELAETIADVLPQLNSSAEIWVRGESAYGFAQIDQVIEQETGTSIAGLEFRPPAINDHALYIYTSGTTGLPKAAKVSHFRLMQWSYWFAGLMDTGPSDRMLNCLPMYHSVGGIVAIGSVLVTGGSVVIRQKFSSSHFWDEVAEWDCTLFQYIGELCRYLVNAPQHPRETEHRLRLCCGNGLRADVWPEFQRRFRIPQILEFYASTEGNVSLYNCEGKAGAIGRVPSFLAHRSNLALVKYDFETEAPVRNEEGFCVASLPAEVGEAIGKIGDDASQTSRFEGYADVEASDKKVLRNVFASGDAWFRTGDLMRRDNQGYYYFVDRVGDTFRWKGENVATAEVATKISAYPDILEAIIYGVPIPGTEGRAGMVTVVAGERFELDAFHKYLRENLPDYARPLFLRLCDTIETTATFKSKAHELKQEGYNPAVIADAVFFNDRIRQAFVKLDAALYESIQAGRIFL